MASTLFKETIVSESNGILSVTFDRPKRKNAFNQDMYLDFLNALKFARENQNIKVVLVTGQGDYYSSGNDLGNFMTVDMSDTELVNKMMKQSRDMLKELVKELVICPKILIAIVNGPSIGIGCTHLAHFDFVYTIDSAWFQTPFIPLAQVPECCSSYLFPKIFGNTIANDILINARKFTGQEAKHLGFVTNSFPTLAEAQTTAMEVANGLSESSTNALLNSKALIKSEDEIQRLLKVNEIEAEQLYQCWMHPDLITAVMKFMSRPKSKL